MRYFEKDGYYAKDDLEHRKASFWYGKGAVALGLANDPAKSNRMRNVAPEDFKRVLQGYVPSANQRGTDQRLGHVRDGEHKHAPGFDITLSAPKSVSLAGLLNGDKRVMVAHRDAVIKTMNYVEDRFLQTRTHDPATGKKPRVNSPHLVGAVFEHIASRKHDPQIHSHFIVANMTRNKDGQWRSIEATEIRRNEKLIGAFYRNELAKNLVEIGYKLEAVPVGKMQSFEIVGYDKDLRDAFSRRRQDILNYISDRGQEYSPRAAQQAALITRERKAEPDLATMKQEWQNRLADLQKEGIGTSLHKPRRSPSFAPPTLAAKQEVAGKSVDWAIAHLEERKTVFTRSELLTTALTQTPGATDVPLLEKQLNKLEEAGRIIGGIDHRNHDVFTTDRTIATERDILMRLKQGQKQGAVIMAPDKTAQRLAGSELTSDQQKAVQTILGSKDRIIGIQGIAGSGKTRMLERVVELTKTDTRTSGIQVLGLAPTASAARSLTDGAGIRSNTLQSFLTRYGSAASGSMTASDLAHAKQNFGGSILVVDEASLASTVQMRDLLRITEKLDFSRVVLVGDSKQLNAVGAGAPFRLMQHAGMETVRMGHIVRQRNPVLKEAVHAASLGRPDTALELLKDDVHEVEKSDLCRDAAERWLELSDERRGNTMVIAPMRSQRDEINETIRDRLLEEGKIGGAQLSITHLNSYRMTRAQKQDASNYQMGDAVVFAVDSNRAGLSANDIYFVRDKKSDDGISLQNTGGKRFTFSPKGGETTRFDIASRLDVYEPVEMVLQAGDSIRWTRNDKKRGLLNAHEASITGITTDKAGAQFITMKTDDGRDLRMAGGDPQLSHCNYAYSSTVHAAQGKTADHVITVMDADHAALSNQKMLYVEISRARDGVTLLTDDRIQLVDTLVMNSGEQVSGLEATGNDITPKTDAAQIVPEVNTPAQGAIVEAEIRMPVFEATDHDIGDEIGRDISGEIAPEVSGESAREIDAAQSELEKIDLAQDTGVELDSAVAEQGLENGKEKEIVDSNNASTENGLEPELKNEKTKDYDMDMEM